MAILTKGQTFADSDSVTSTKLNNLVDNAAFVAGASGSTDNTSLEVNGSGKLQVKDSGITSTKLASSAVTTAKIASSSSATNGVTFSKLQYVANMRAIGNVSGSLGVASEVSILDEDDMVSDSATSLATQQSTKAYVDNQVSVKNTLTVGTVAASTSGTAIEYTGLPAAIKRINIIFNGVSTNGNSRMIIQLGTSEAYVITGYEGGSADSGGSAANTSGLIIQRSQSASNIHYGITTLTRLGIGSNDWISSGANSRDSVVSTLAGGIALGGELTRIRLTTEGGVNTFDAGSINITYE